MSYRHESPDDAYDRGREEDDAEENIRRQKLTEAFGAQAPILDALSRGFDAIFKNPAPAAQVAAPPSPSSLDSGAVGAGPRYDDSRHCAGCGSRNVSASATYCSGCDPSRGP